MLDVGVQKARISGAHLQKPEHRMGFVTESIDTPERIREFDALNLVSPVTLRAPKRWRWAVDRGRGFYLVGLGGGFSEIPHLYALVVPGGVIRIEGHVSGSGNPLAGNMRVSWKVTSVQIPLALASRADELMGVVREALEARGYYFEPERTLSVDITLPAPTIV